MADRVVTVFGGSGFLGRHIVQRLAAEGWIVRVAVRDVEQAQFLKTMGEIGQVVPMAVDAGDPERVAFALDGADAVINLIGILFEKGRRTFQRLHVEVAGAIAAAAAAAGVKQLVHVSAIGADRLSPAAYARTKAEGEEAVRAAFPSATILRPSVVFGPEDQFFNTFAGMTRLSPYLPLFGCPPVPRLGWHKKGRAISIDLYGEGGTRFQPVYVGDVAGAAVAALRIPAARGKTYELGGPRVFSFKEVMELVLRSTGRRRLLLPVPFALGRILAWFLEFAPRPPLTRDQVALLGKDNVVTEGALTLADLGIRPTAAEMVVPGYLVRFRPPRAKGLPTV